MSSIPLKTHEERLRSAEFDLVRHEFNTEDKVLEIGGGSGFQAALISECVQECQSVDVRPHPQPVHPVSIYDGKILPFEDQSFDIIFSSNVLEHISDLDDALYECARVLKPGGKMVHVVPSHWWRIWTLLSYYPALPKILLCGLRDLRKPDASDAELSRPLESTGVKEQNQQRDDEQGLLAIVQRRFKLKWIRTIVLSPRHGERGNEITEIYYFSPSWWRRMFERNGWCVLEETPCHLFYSGNTLFGSILSIKMRRLLSRFLGSSTYIYKVSLPTHKSEDI
jgi:SAM-dependent methyltransferase